MNTLTPADLASLRQLLLSRLEALRAELRAEAFSTDRPASGEVIDHKDEAARLQMAELRGAEEQRDVDELARVEAALHRLDTEGFGRCVACEEPIPVQRLMVQPAATRCAACQAAHERALSGTGKHAG
jgi:DnaK suppressor protein